MSDATRDCGLSKPDLGLIKAGYPSVEVDVCVEGVDVYVTHTVEDLQVVVVAMMMMIMMMMTMMLLMLLLMIMMMMQFTDMCAACSRFREKRMDGRGRCQVTFASGG